MRVFSVPRRWRTALPNRDALVAGGSTHRSNDPSTEAMKLRAVHAIIAVMAIVITLLSWALVYYSRDELGTQALKHDDDIKTVSAAGVEAGRAVVHLSAQSQAAAGIVVQPLKAAKRETAFEAYGIVANLQPL